MGVYLEQNKAKILKLIYSEGRVSTKDLSRRLKMSSETIRRYLEILEEESKIKRIHGGAERLSSYTSEENISMRLTQREGEKRKIAKIASTLINNGDKIIIDEGSTALQLVNFIEGKRDLLILTSSFPVAIAVMSLLNKGKITGELVFLGGVVQSDNKRTVGKSCIEMVKSYSIDKAFISCEGITLDGGVTAFNELKAEVTREYIQVAKEKILLADFTKVGIKNFYKIDELINIDKIVSNKDVPKGWEVELDNWRVEWIGEK